MEGKIALRPPKDFFREGGGIWNYLLEPAYNDALAHLEASMVEARGLEALEEFRSWMKSYERHRKSEEDALDEPLRLLRDIRNKDRNEFGLLMEPIRETHRRVVGK